MRNYKIEELEERVISILKTTKISRDNIAKFMPLMSGLYQRNFEVTKETFGDPKLGEIFEIMQGNQEEMQNLAILIVKASRDNKELLEAWAQIGFSYGKILNESDKSK